MNTMTDEELKARVAEVCNLCRRAGQENSARILGYSDEVIRLYGLGRRHPSAKFWRRFERVRDKLEEVAKTWADVRREKWSAQMRTVNAKYRRKAACRENFERIRDEELNVYGHRIGFATLYQKSRKAGDGVGFVWNGKKKTYYFTCSNDTCKDSTSGEVCHDGD